MVRLGSGAGLALVAVAAAQLAAHQGLSSITVDYPAAESIFPPDMVAPTFLWRDPEKRAAAWRIGVTVAGGAPAIEVPAPGEHMRIGEIDERCIAETNKLPELTPQQAETRTWKPDAATWEAIERQSVAGKAVVTITGFADKEWKQ